jgi:hypothetical protein
MEKPKALKALRDPAPNAPAPVPLPVASAVKALHEGTATSHQQQLALQWIIREAAGKAYFPYHPTDRDTTFALGKVFVADQIIGLFNADLSSLRSGSNEKP